VVSQVRRLREAQARARQRRVQASRQLQQQALITGKSVQQLQREKEFAQFKSQQIKLKKETEARQKEEERLRKEAEAKARRPDGKSVTQLAYEAIQRQAMGKSATGITYGRPDVVKEAERLMRENPELKRAVSRGVGLKISAREAGFESVQEYVDISQALFATPSISAKPTLTTQEQQIITQATKGYEGLGFSKSESKYLAQEGSKQQMSFTPEYAKGLLERRRVQALFSPTITTPKTKFEEAIIEKRVEVPTEFKDVIQPSRDIDIGGFGRVDGIVEPRYEKPIGKKGFEFIMSPSFTKGSEFFGQVTEKVKEKRREAEREEKVSVYGYGLAGLGLGVVKPVFEIGAFGEKLVTKPKETAILMGIGVKESALFGYERIKTREFFPEVGKKLYQDPGVIIGQTTGDILVGYGIGTGISKGIGKAQVIKTKISPTYRPISYGIDTFEDLAKFKPKSVVSGEAFAEVPSALGKIKRVPTTRGKIDIDIAGSIGSPTLPEMTLKQQARLAGKKVTAISGQADFPTQFFDEGLLFTKPLEKTFYADPFGRIRPTRLGLQQPRASVLDYLVGDVTLLRAKPKIFVFPEAQIAKFPKHLKDVAKKLREGKSLTPSEIKRLQKFQETPTGEFKPIGFLSKEPEVILPTGEQLLKVQKLGKTVIEKRKVDIYELEVGKIIDKQQVSQKVDDIILGKGKGISQEKFLEQTLESKRILQTPYVSPVSIVGVPSKLLLRSFSNLPKISGVDRGLSKITSPVDLSKPIEQLSLPPKTFPPQISPVLYPEIVKPISPIVSLTPKPSKIIYPISYLPVSKPPIPTPPIPLRYKKRRILKKEKQKGYNVQFMRFARMKKGKKVPARTIKVNPKPLTKHDAMNLAFYGSDVTLNRQFKITPAKTKAQKPTFKVPENYWRLHSYKFRPYRIVKGKPKPFFEHDRFIERKQYVGDTASEMKRLHIEKFIADRKKKSYARNVRQGNLNKIFFPQFRQNSK